MTFAQLADNPFLAILAIATAVLGVGRLSRIITYDAFPPAIALRLAWTRAVGEAWGKLLTCWWCLTPWLMLVSFGWFALGIIVTWIAVAWWIFWGWLALSYVSSIIIARDEPSNE